MFLIDFTSNYTVILIGVSDCLLDVKQPTAPMSRSANFVYKTVGFCVFFAIVHVILYNEADGASDDTGIIYIQLHGALRLELGVCLKTSLLHPTLLKEKRTATYG